MLNKKVIILSLGLLAVTAPAVANNIGLSRLVGNGVGELSEVVVLVVQAVQWIGVGMFVVALCAFGAAKLNERQAEDWHIKVMVIGALMYLGVALFEAVAESVTQEDESIRNRLNNPSVDEAF